MNKNSQHTIRRQVLDLDFGSETVAKGMQKTFRDLTLDHLNPAIGNILDEQCLPGKVFRIEQLVLELGHLNIQDLDKQFISRAVQEFREAIEKQLGQVAASPGWAASSSAGTEAGPALAGNSQAGPSLTGEEEVVWEAFIFFLKTGRLPWWADKCIHTGLETSALQAIGDIQENRKETWQELLRVFQGYPESIRRLLRQFSKAFVEALISKALPKALSHFRFWILAMERAVKTLRSDPAEPSAIEQQLWEILLQEAGKLNFRPAFWLGPAFFEAAISRLARQLRFPAGSELMVAVKKEALAHIKTQALPKGDTQEIKKLLAEWDETFPFVGSREETSDPIPIELGAEKSRPPQLQKGEREEEIAIYVHQAGLVIIAPYLERFFGRLGMLEGRRFIDQKARERAVHILHYLATREEQPMEYELALHKVLCSLPLKHPLERDIHLSEAEKEECENLLQAVIQHWTALKNTSVDMLRGNFLVRFGKLSCGEGHKGWKLLVEKKAYDLLLSQLPWGIAMIKLPWMEEKVVVEW